MTHLPTYAVFVCPREYRVENTLVLCSNTGFPRVASRALQSPRLQTLLVFPLLPLALLLLLLPLLSCKAFFLEPAHRAVSTDHG